jgi:hypothetical protein
MWTPRIGWDDGKGASYEGNTMEGAAVETGTMGRFVVRLRRSRGLVVIETKGGWVVVGRWRASEVEGEEVVGGIGVVEDS